MTHEGEAIRYCHDCRYALRGLEGSVCPECGRGFDLKDPASTSAHPQGDARHHIATAVRFLVTMLVWLLVGVFLASLVGVAPLLLWLGGFAFLPVAAILLIVLLFPVVPVTPRTRALGLLGIVLLYSIVYYGWPMRLSFLLHRSAMDQAVARVHAGELQEGQAFLVGWLSFQRYRQLPGGQIGFQLNGGPGGGTFLVRRPDDQVMVWLNTNWELNLGGGWFWVEQD